jgi:hypothetical protein
MYDVAPMSPAGTGSKWYRESLWKWLLIYAASPLVMVFMVACVFMPYLGILAALIIGTGAEIRRRSSPSRR